MTKALIGILIVFLLALPVSAEELTAPEVPESGFSLMPQDTQSFPNCLWELIRNGVLLICPELKSALTANTSILVSAFLFSSLSILSEKMTKPASIAGIATIAAAMFQHADTMIEYAVKTVWDICEYGKLLCPVLTTALAAQGVITASSALYVGTVAFLTLLETLISNCMIPMLYMFLIFSTANCALEEDIFKKFADTIKSVLQWVLKSLIIIFTTYMSLSGTVSGATDLAALKAAKLTMSTVVPVVGGILSDASESVLISMDIIKNTAGIYGILATLAVFMGPFIKVGVQYLVLKLTALICSLFPSRNISSITDHFSTAMGLLLAMLAVSCILVLISTVCFMRGIG